MTSSSVTSGARGHTRQILATTLHSDWTQFEPLAALRCTTAVAIALMAGTATGYAPIGVFGAIGAVSFVPGRVSQSRRRNALGGPGHGGLDRARLARGARGRSLGTGGRALGVCERVGSGARARRIVRGAAVGNRGHSRAGICRDAGKPEFQNTFARGIGRVAGTLAGAVLATAIAAALEPGHGMLIVVVLACVWAGYAVFRINYVAFSVCITGYVVFLLGLAGLDQRDVVVERVFDTLLGGGIALIAYALWPTWSGVQVQMLLADLLEAHARYTRLLLAALAEPARFDASALARARSAGRLLRSNTEAAIDRMVGEPAGVQSIDPRVALGVVAALRRGALAALALHSALEDEQRHALLWLAGLGEDVGGVLTECAAAMRSGTAPPQPAFRLDPPSGEDPWTRIAFAEAEMIADSAATVATILAARQAGSPRVALSPDRP